MIPARAPRSRSWLGCLNNYTNAELEQLKAHECRYMALGFHVGVKSHLPHVHIDVEYKTMKTRPKLNARIHWEPRRGTLKQALDYLNKEEKLEERGDRPRLDSKISTTVEEHYADACHGEVHPESAIYMRYRNYLDHIANAHKPAFIWDGELNTKNLWLWGPTGTGKSTFVTKAAQAEGVSVYKKRKNKWWDGYVDQRYVLIEDIMPEDCQFLTSMIKEWADRFDFLGEVKGGTIRIEPTYRFIITSNHPPCDCIKNPKDLAAVARRFEVIEDVARAPHVATPLPSPGQSQTWDDILPSWH